ncbi:uncharacterized protein [Drosophila virilis]|uniref:E3 ubiquitin-protein ligase E3D n=1 Tax=Drosophila virilis TaxID=7244 RepID=B4M301_DROVI|nr:uncharacterized protein LOC6632071 [Drosophila virilis]EDW65176.1 uncharacterized protein Dvir_GJ19047 [Drosophila virilis]
MPLQAVCIELRPNLSSGHVFLQFDQEIRDRQKTRLIIKEHDVHIVENGTDSTESELVLRHDSFGMDIQRISVFIVNGCHISFRFNYTTIDLEALENCVGLPMAPQPLLLSFAERTQTVSLHCSNCHNQLVPGCSYSRLREFPSGIIDPSEFFCHNHGTVTKPATLVPRRDDLYYGLNHVVLNMTAVEAQVINRSEHLYCKRCMWMLGLTIESGSAAKLWADALRWLPSAVKTEDATQQEPRQLFKYSTVTQLLLRLLNDLWPTFCPGNSRALLVANMPDRHQHYMLIQVLDPQLSVLRRTGSETPKCTDPQQLQHSRACKLYFRVFGSCQQDPTTLIQWQEQMQVPKMTISPYMFLELQARLNCNSMLIPHAWRYNTAEEKLLLTYFFYENEHQELLNQQKKKEGRVNTVQTSQKPTQQPQEQKKQQQELQQKKQQQELQQKKQDDYETDAGLDASLDEADESDDERSDSDSELTSSLLNKSVPIMAYEQNLVKRWPLQKKRKQPQPPNANPDTSD